MKRYFEAVMEEKRRQTYPKKYLKGVKILDGRVYICVWIPDTPYTRYYPKPVLYIKSKNMGCRIVLDNPDEISGFIIELSEFVIKEIDNIKTSLKEAIEDWERLHNEEYIKKTREEFNAIYEQREKKPCYY